MSVIFRNAKRLYGSNMLLYYLILYLSQENNNIILAGWKQT